MQEFKPSVACVIATKDRPELLRRLLWSLKAQSYKPVQIVIVDSSKNSDEKITQEFLDLPVKYMIHQPPSGTAQRNAGVEAVDQGIEFVGIVDDDAVLEANALEAMMNFWEEANEDVGGASFNLLNHPQTYASVLKSRAITEKLGFYSKNNGKVLSSGFHTLIGTVKRTTWVQWLPSTFVIWRKRVFDDYKFDEWFSGYSYLEDLDFSYRVGKEYKLAIVADARFYHYPAPGGRGSGYRFGIREVLNRVYFVRKYEELSRLKCYLALKVRMLISISMFIKERKFSFLQRTAGNVVGIIKSFFIIL